MKRMNAFVALVLLAACLPGIPAFGQQKLAQTGMKFLQVGTSARFAALSDAATAVEGNSSAMFFNPACMARQSTLTDVSVGRTEWIADINHTYGSVAFSPADGDYGVIGIMFQTVDYGEVQATVRANNEAGYIDVGTFKPTGLAIGVSYARALSDKFSVGGNVKYVTQDLGDAAVQRDENSGQLTFAGNSANVIAFDFGLLYRTGFKSLNFGMTVRNFSREVQYVDESFQLPLTFKIGLSMNMFDLMDMNSEQHALLLAFDAEKPRDFDENIRVGMEYVFLQTLSLRAGYAYPRTDQEYTLGAGVKQTVGGVGLEFDYAFTPFDVFSNVHRFSFRFSL
jgi:Type IX secretion system protein PorV